MRWLFLILSAAIWLVSLLNVVRAPDWVWTWKLAILTGEYGHWLVLLPVGVAVAAVVGATGAGRVGCLAFCLMAAGCFLRPVFTARQIAANLPQELRAAFGGETAPSTLDLKRLYHHPAGPMAQVQAEIFSRPDGQELKLDFYRPASAKDVRENPRPCVLVIHGGGWDSGDRTQLPGLNHRLVAQGYAVAAIDYRLAPRWQWPAPREDALAALAWVTQNSSRLGLDASRFVLLGRSAGAQIAEVTAYTAHDPAIRGVIAFYGPSDMVFGYRNASEDDAIRSPSLMRAYLGGTPEQQPARYDDASAAFRHPGLTADADAPRLSRHAGVAPARRAAGGPTGRGRGATFLSAAAVGDARLRLQPGRAGWPARRHGHQGISQPGDAEISGQILEGSRPCEPARAPQKARRDAGPPKSRRT